MKYFVYLFMLFTADVFLCAGTQAQGFSRGRVSRYKMRIHAFLFVSLIVTRLFQMISWVIRGFKSMLSDALGETVNVAEKK